MIKPQKPTPDFPLFPHANGQWAKKIRGELHYFGPWNDSTAALARFQSRMTIPMKRVSPTGAPEKPTKDFPLFAHASKQWAKKIKGKMYYFGPWSDPQGALERYVADRDDLYAGRPRRRAGELTIADLCDAFMAVKRQRFEGGEITERTFKECDESCRRAMKILGATTAVASLRPTDFDRVRGVLSKRYGLVRLYNEVGSIRAIFKFAYERELIEKPIRFGDFKRPTRKALRIARQKNVTDNGLKMFSADDLRRVIEGATNGVKSPDGASLFHANPQLVAMIYLGINCGFGNNDCVMLPQSALDLAKGWVNFGRPKTGTDRRCPLWPETVAALKAVLADRPAAKEATDDGRVFITKYGSTWGAKSTCDSPISKEMAKLLKALNMKRRGVGFYALRHTFQTIGNRSLDKDAVRYIMGHAESAGDMSAVYTEERPDDKRLRAVTSGVRQWLNHKTARRAG